MSARPVVRPANPDTPPPAVFELARALARMIAAEQFAADRREAGTIEGETALKSRGSAHAPDASRA